MGGTHPWFVPFYKLLADCASWRRQRLQVALEFAITALDLLVYNLSWSSVVLPRVRVEITGSLLPRSGLAIIRVVYITREELYVCVSAATLATPYRSLYSLLNHFCYEMELSRSRCIIGVATRRCGASETCTREQGFVLRCGPDGWVVGVFLLSAAPPSHFLYPPFLIHPTPLFLSPPPSLAVFTQCPTRCSPGPVLNGQIDLGAFIIVIMLLNYS